MDDLFKKFLYTGVGIVSNTAETMQKTVDEWIEKGNISKEEGKRIIEDFVAEADKRKNEYSGKVKDFVSQAKGQLDVPTREEVDELSKRIAELEARLASNKDK